MNTKLVEEILAKADLLSSEEQLHVIASLAEKARKKNSVSIKPQRKWMDMAGQLAYPACGEDAQVHVSQARLEADRCRNNNFQRDRP